MVKRIMNHQEAGQKLRELRISLNRGLEQVSSDLKISLDKLEAIETGDVEYFDNLCFYQLFSTTYARYLGLESEDNQQIRIPEKPYPEEIRKEKIKIPLVYIIVSIVIIALISVFVLWKGNNSKPINGNQPPQTEIEKPAETKLVDKPPVQPIVKVVTVKLLVIKDKCWLQVNIDGDEVPIFRRTLFAGEEIEFKGEKEVRLWVGNAGALKIIANGVEQPPIGRDGEVIRDLVFYPPD
ncbi:MAG: hypothetical protein DDT23_00105 [candidate division WS2 bacterium]|nr:hypothetical protein [Candidatus Lithacetigena glycinireducens]